MGQTNNHKSNHFLFLILGCKSFAVNYRLMSWMHRHHQTLGFIPGDALPGLYCNCLQFLLVLGAFSLQFCLQQVKCMLNRIQVRSGDWLGHCITFNLFALKSSLVAFAVCFGSLSICTVKRRPMSSEAFGWIWADNIARNTSEFILLLLSAATSSINTREPVPLAAIHAHAMTLPPPCFTDEAVCFGSWAVPFLLHTLLFPSFWYKLIFVSSVHRMLFQNCKGFCRCCLANSVFEAHQWFTSCGEPSVFTLVKSSLECWLWHTYIYLLESVLDLANCCEGVFLYQGNNYSVIYHSCFPWSSGSFGVAELFLFKNVPNSWFDRLMFLLSLWSVCFDFSA